MATPMKNKTITEQLRALVIKAGPLQRTATAAGVRDKTIWEFAHGAGIHGLTVDRLAKHFDLTLAPKPSPKKKSKKSAKSV